MDALVVSSVEASEAIVVIVYVALFICFLCFPPPLLAALKKKKKRLGWCTQEKKKRRGRSLDGSLVPASLNLVALDHCCCFTHTLTHIYAYMYIVAVHRKPNRSTCQRPPRRLQLPLG